MPGMMQAEAQATLDARFPLAGAGDHFMWSVNGTSEFSGLARTPVGATGWAAATAAQPSVKANANALTTAAATVAGTVSHYGVSTALAGGTQRIDWTVLDLPRELLIGDQLQAGAGTLKVTLD